MIYFSIKELCNSNTADKLHIDNTPQSSTILSNLNNLGNHLDIMRAQWAEPLIVSSGYRCPKLNKAVGGSSTSSHVYGLGADILPKDMKDFEKFKDFIKTFYSKKEHEFDQIILEYNKNSKWIHIGMDPRMRRQFLIYKDGIYKEWK